ncbi:hypothetical protein AXF42_Ash003683 [Apostasia shenzhenica]|uniref:Uncharacterized protein n=1 Tax=Apostasia shenzhenica TaxID=1088818 RepID=A0A2I0AHT7_9ASPA|nr:hypothetical protein AXF42_Ash003683 [Apostasia shenzhenica]
MPMMAHEGSEASVASSSPATNWWEMTTSATPLSWNTTAINHYRWLQPPHPPPSNSSADDDIISISANSFTNMSNHSALTLDYSSSPAAEASGGCGGGDQTDNHLWMNQVLLGVESSGSHGDCGKFLELLSSKTTLPTEMFDPACDYLKKLDSSWEFASTSSSLNSSSTFDAKQLAGSSNGEAGGSLIECEKLTSNLSDLVGNWSIAPPNNLQNNDQNSMIFPQVSPIKHDVILLPTNLPSYPNFDSYVKGDSRGDDMVGGRSCSFSTGFGLKSRYCGTGALMAEENPLMSAPRSNIISDLISFTSLNKPAMEFRAGKPSLRAPAASSESSRKQQFGHGTFSSATRGSGRGGGNESEGKKKRNEESSQTIFKKCRHDSSSSTTTVSTHNKDQVHGGLGEEAWKKGEAKLI